MNTRNLDVNNQNLFDFSKFTGSKGFNYGKFSNIGGSNLSGTWTDSGGSSIIITDDGMNTVITQYYGPTSVPLIFGSDNSFSAHFYPETNDRFGSLSDNNTKIHWTKNGQEDGYWTKVSDSTSVSNPNPTQGIGNTVVVPVTPITPPGTPVNPPKPVAKFEQTILDFQQWANKTHHENLAEDGIAGPEVAKAFDKYKSEYNLYLVGKNTHTTIWGMPAWAVYTGGGIITLGLLFAGYKFVLKPMLAAKSIKSPNIAVA